MSCKTQEEPADEGKSSFESKFTSNPLNPNPTIGSSKTSNETATTTTTTTATATESATASATATANANATTASSKSAPATDLGASHVGRVQLTQDQQLLHRAVGHLYSKIIQPKEENGWLEWFEGNCMKFDVKKRSEHGLIYTELHKEYESMVETALIEFTAKEGIKDQDELYTRIFRATKEKKYEATVNLLLAAADYKKFVALMKRKKRQLLKKQVQKKPPEQVVALNQARQQQMEQLQQLQNRPEQKHEKGQQEEVDVEEEEGPLSYRKK